MPAKGNEKSAESDTYVYVYVLSPPLQALSPKQTNTRVTLEEGWISAIEIYVGTPFLFRDVYL